MSTVKEIGVPFPLSLVTSPRQFGLTDFEVKRYVVTTEADLGESTDVTSIVDVDEFIEDVNAYTGTITVSTDRVRTQDRVGVTGDVNAELVVGHVLQIGAEMYRIKNVSIDAAGDGYIDLETPLRADVTGGMSITRTGNTGRYRITIQEDVETVVQYNVVSPSSIPQINEDTPIVVIDTIDDGPGSSAPITDNSTLLL